MLDILSKEFVDVLFVVVMYCDKCVFVIFF